MAENIWRVYINHPSPAGGETNNTYQLIEQSAEPTTSIAGNVIDTNLTSLVVRKVELTASNITDITTGTWEPIISDIADEEFVMTSQIGNYLKIGTCVFISLSISWNGKGLTTGSLSCVISLPFPSTKASGLSIGGMTGITGGDTNEMMMCQTSNIGNSRFFLKVFNVITGNETILIISDYATTGSMFISGVYFTN